MPVHAKSVQLHIILDKVMIVILILDKLSNELVPPALSENNDSTTPGVKTKDCWF